MHDQPHNTQFTVSESTIGQISHDLKNPLSTIKLLTQVMQRRHAELAHDELLDLLGQIDAQCTILETTINESARALSETPSRPSSSH